MKKEMLLKRMASNVMSSTGIHSLTERVCCFGKSFVLMYHRILPSAADQPYFVQPGMFVSMASFERQIAFLKHKFKIVFLEDLVEMRLKREEIGGHCAITFDDGWRDNYTEAFPILKKYNAPATIFLATGFVGTDRMFWPEELCCYLTRNLPVQPGSEDAPLSFIRLNQEFGRCARVKDARFFDSAIEILKKFSPGERDELLGYFRVRFGNIAIPRQMLSWDETQEMYTSGLVRFGSHTVNHEMLDQISLEKAEDEIFLSRQKIERRRLGNAVRIFAYPNGNYSESIQNILAKSGFNAAVTTCKGFLSRGTPLMEIPRIAIHEDVSNTIPMFRSRILFRKC